MSKKNWATLERGPEGTSDCTGKNRLRTPYRQPRGVTAYEQLRREWFELNPIHTEAELAAACIVMARNCGLVLLNQLRGLNHGTEP